MINKKNYFDTDAIKKLQSSTKNHTIMYSMSKQTSKRRKHPLCLLCALRCAPDKKWRMCCTFFSQKYNIFYINTINNNDNYPSTLFVCCNTTVIIIYMIRYTRRRRRRSTTTKIAETKSDKVYAFENCLIIFYAFSSFMSCHSWFFCWRGVNG